MKRIFHALAFISVLLLMACDSGTIGQVKNGTFSGRETITVGTAFENAFGNVKWEAFTATTGQNVVEITGLVDENFLIYFANKMFDGVPLDTYEGKILCAEDFARRVPKTPESSFKEKFYRENHSSLNECAIKIVSALPAPNSKFKTQIIMHVNSDEFELGHYGFEDTTYKITSVLNKKDFLDYVYSNHVFEKSAYPECSSAKIGEFIMEEFVCDEKGWRGASISEIANKQACIHDGETKTFDGDEYRCNYPDHEWTTNVEELVGETDYD